MIKLISKKALVIVLFSAIVLIGLWMFQQYRQRSKKTISEAALSSPGSQTSYPSPAAPVISETPEAPQLSVKKGQVISLDNKQITIKDESGKQVSTTLADKVEVVKQQPPDPKAPKTQIVNGKELPLPPVPATKKVSLTDIKVGDRVTLNLITRDKTTTVTLINVE